MCSSYLPHEMPAECTAYSRKLREKQAAAAARGRPSAHRRQAPSRRTGRKESARRRAPCPRAEAACAGCRRPPQGAAWQHAGRAPLYGQLVLTGFSGRATCGSAMLNGLPWPARWEALRRYPAGFERSGPVSTPRLDRSNKQRRRLSGADGQRAARRCRTPCLPRIRALPFTLRPTR